MIKLKVSYKFKGLIKTIKVDGLEVRSTTIALFGNKNTDLIMLSDLVSITGEFTLETPSIDFLKQRNEENGQDKPMITVDIEMSASDRRVLNEAIYPAIKKAKSQGLKELKINIPNAESVAAVLNKGNEYTAVSRDNALIILWQ